MGRTARTTRPSRTAWSWHTTRSAGPTWLSRPGRRGQTTRPSRTAWSSQTGYSLIEVLWVMALVAFLLVGMGELILQAFQAGRKAEETALKTALLGTALEGFKARPYADPALAAGEYADDGRLFPGGKAVRTEWRIGPAAGGLKLIEFSLFLESERDRGLKSALLISEVLGF
jgi:prepilin-type N-terminal cleavage/methylation domain-containing protein